MATEAVWTADAMALADRISSLLTVVRSAEAEIGALLVEIESRGVLELFGYRSAARLLEHLADLPAPPPTYWSIGPRPCIPATLSTPSPPLLRPPVARCSTGMRETASM